tara:strand:+ start:3220 stop:3393 length:174 start_codon:yes stop_codon:yes gene_type:complete
MRETIMENTNTLPDIDNTIMNLTNIIASLNPNWIQQIMMEIYLNDIQEIYYQRGITL